VIAMTTLKAYRRRPLELAIYRGDKVRDKKLIVRVSGIHPLMVRRRYRALLDNYDVSYLYFTRQQDYELLEDAVMRRGRPTDFNSLHYPRALWTTLVVKGYESPESRLPVTRTTKVWFASRESE
jgi:hypothetical protein